MTSANANNTANSHPQCPVTPPPFELSFDLNSPESVQRTARYLQGRVSEKQQQIWEMSRQLQTMAADDDTRTAAAGAGGKRTRDDISDEEDEGGPMDMRERVRRGAHIFGVMVCVFLRKGALTFEEDLPDDFDENKFEQRFANSRNKVRGQLKDALAYLPPSIHESRKEPWFGAEFCHSKKGLGDQRSNIAHRIRKKIEHALGVSPDELATRYTRRALRNKIGYNPATEKYSKLDIEVLHRKWEDKYNPSDFLRSETVMKVFVACLRGPEAAKHFKPGVVASANTETMESKHQVRNITPHAIANAGMLTVWALSADERLQTVGNVTTINYLDLYDTYLKILLKGLEKKLPSVRGLIRDWDDAIFPGTDSSILKPRQQAATSSDQQVDDALGAMDEEEPEEDDEEGENGEPEDGGEGAPAGEQLEGPSSAAD